MSKDKLREFVADHALDETTNRITTLAAALPDGWFDYDLIDGETVHTLRLKIANGAVEMVNYVDSTEAPTDLNPALLRTLRERMGISIAWLADYFGIKEVNIRAWETGKKTIPVNRAAQFIDLVDAFDTACEEFAEKIEDGLETVVVPMNDQDSPDNYPASWHRAVAGILFDGDYRIIYN